MTATFWSAAVFCRFRTSNNEQTIKPIVKSDLFVKQISYGDHR
jgi:hypothetical protein